MSDEIIISRINCDDAAQQRENKNIHTNTCFSLIVSTGSTFDFLMTVFRHCIARLIGSDLSVREKKEHTKAKLNEATSVAYCESCADHNQIYSITIGSRAKTFRECIFMTPG